MPVLLNRRSANRFDELLPTAPCAGQREAMSLAPWFSPTDQELSNVPPIVSTGFALVVLDKTVRNGFLLLSFPDHRANATVLIRSLHVAAGDAALLRYKLGRSRGNLTIQYQNRGELFQEGRCPHF